jgi:hypothetical protein
MCNANGMFVREKRIGAYSYVYLVETVREDGRIKQRIIRNLGRKEAVEAAGDLDRLARSATRLSQRSMILSLIEGGSAPDLTCHRIGGGRLAVRAPLRVSRRARDLPDRAASADGLGLRPCLRALAR